MRDNMLDVFLMALFGTGGITIMILAWAWPMPVSERMVTISIGSLGVIWAIVRGIALILTHANANAGEDLIEAGATKKPR